MLDFEIACVAAALEQWSARAQPGRLFVILSASALLERVQARSADALMTHVRKLGLQPRMLVIEITEHEHAADIKALREAVQEVQAAGVMLALDDFGDGRSSLHLWSELQPDIVKIDKYFTAELSRHAKKLQTLRALMQIAEVFGTTLVAEGIEVLREQRVSVMPAMRTASASGRCREVKTSRSTTTTATGVAMT